jgi:DNA primase small subunit
MDLEKQQMMKLYYKSYFPVELLFEWLRIDERREISFTLPSKGYLRYQTFESPEELKERIVGLTPERIDVGAFYRERPTKHNHGYPVRRELVFDVDLTDYPRTCCMEKAVCERCFLLIKSALKLLNYSLREEFDFEKVAFVFSGRRGLHCWVTDEMAMDLPEAERGEIVRYFNTVLEKKTYPKEYSRILREDVQFIEDQGFSEDGEVSDALLFDKMYLRLDRNVTQSLPHLVKSPFSIHPDTGAVCVPIDPAAIDGTRLRDFPSLHDVIKEPESFSRYIEVARTWL